MLNSRDYIIEIEKKLLSAMMLKEGKVIPTVEQILQASDFYRVEHRLIYQAMLTVYDKGGTPPDIFLIEEALEKTGDLIRVKHAYLFSLIDYEFTTARAEQYAHAIKEKARLRLLDELGQNLSDGARNGAKTSVELEGMLEDTLQSNMPVVEERNNAKEAYGRIMREIMDRGKKGNEPSDLSTGLYNLNRIIGGFHKTDLMILAARPAMGKTALAINVAASIAAEKNVLFFSLEMSEKQIWQRLLSSLSEVEASRIFREKLTFPEMEKLLAIDSQFERLKFTVCDKGGMTLREIRNRARFEKQKYGLDFVVIDYLQLIQGDNAYRGNRVQEVSEISRGLKALAKELDVPILALSQLSRNVEMRAEKKPQLSDLRDSGSIEQDADIVMFLYRDEYYKPDEADNEKIAELNVAKNRNGMTGTAYLRFEKKYLQFRDLTRSAD